MQADTTRPTRLIWVFPKIAKNKSWVDYLQSKTLKKLAVQIPQLLQKSGTSISFLPLTNPAYVQWHAYYKNNMLSLGHKVIANQDWYETNQASFKNAWLVELRLHDEIVGGSIISENFAHKFTHHYKASNRTDTAHLDNFSFGTILELCYIEFAFSHNASEITSGMSRNGFGYFNSLGYLTTKLRSGYFAVQSSEHPTENLFPKHSETTPTAWFVLDKNNLLKLLLFPSKEQFSQELLSYVSKSNIPVLEYNQLL